MSFKNEEVIKEKIVECHRRGVCDRNGESVKITDSSGRKIFVAKPRFGLSSMVKTYVYRNGRMVLKGTG
jgi:hypothetical protein